MRMNHVGIVVADLEAAVTFMTSVLGLERSARQPEPNLRAAFFDCGPIQIQLVEDSERLGAAPVGRLEHIAIDVDDLDALQDRMRRAGVELEYDEPKVYGDPPRFRTQFTAERDGSLGVKFQLTERFG
jgi:catechol 2,3-dioxygenase-like lactoylglutathione lyase family enzyme